MYSIAPGIRTQHPPYPSIETNVTRPQHANVPGAVAILLETTKELQEMLRLWSLQQVSDEQVSDVYVTLGNQFNATVTAFQYYDIDLSDLYSTPTHLRNVLEDCLSNDPSPDVFAKYRPRVLRIIKELLQGLRNKQPAYWHAVGHSPPVSPPFSPYTS
ncbi:hypothetical protein PENSPDRAFT_681870 [Peniophora sp. CONT]|nr:hypothetical protein PENSPDRAFT_681870 [Peniophora sp. CONT]